MVLCTPECGAQQGDQGVFQCTVILRTRPVIELASRHLQQQTAQQMPTHAGAGDFAKTGARLEFASWQMNAHMTEQALGQHLDGLCAIQQGHVAFTQLDSLAVEAQFHDAGLLQHEKAETVFGAVARAFVAGDGAGITADVRDLGGAQVLQLDITNEQCVVMGEARRECTAHRRDFLRPGVKPGISLLEHATSVHTAVNN